jgi:hypothetical protein
LKQSPLKTQIGFFIIGGTSVFLFLIGLSRVDTANCRVVVHAWNSSDPAATDPILFQMNIGSAVSYSQKVANHNTWSQTVNFNCSPGGSLVVVNGSAIVDQTTPPLSCDPIQLNVMPSKPVTVEYEVQRYRIGPEHYDNSCTITVL